MKRLVTVLVIALCAASPAFAQKSGSNEDTAPVQLVEPTTPGGDQVVGYHDADQRMNNAIAEARRYLLLFMDEFRSASTQSRGAFTVKVALTTSDGGREHIWAGDLRYEGQNLVGNLINEPYDLPGLSLGSRVEIPDADISDWSIATPEGVFGGFTSRVMIDDMPPAEAAQYREALQLTASPVPPGWMQ